MDNEKVEEFEKFKNEIGELCEKYGLGIVCTFQKQDDASNSMTVIHQLSAYEAHIGVFHAYKNVLQRDLKGWNGEKNEEA